MALSGQTQRLPKVAMVHRRCTCTAKPTPPKVHVFCPCLLRSTCMCSQTKCGLQARQAVSDTTQCSDDATEASDEVVPLLSDAALPPLPAGDSAQSEGAGTVAPAIALEPTQVVGAFGAVGDQGDITTISPWHSKTGQVESAGVHADVNDHNGRQPTTAACSASSDYRPLLRVQRG